MRGRGPFNSIFPDEIFGFPFSILMGLIIFWVLVVLFVITRVSDRQMDGEEIFAVIIGVGLAFLSAWIWGRYGFLIFWVIGAIGLFVLIIYLIYKFCDYPSDIFKGIAVALFFLGGCIFFYFHIVEEKRKMIFSLSFLYKILSVIGALGLICFFVWISVVYYRKSKKIREEVVQERRRLEEQRRLQEEQIREQEEQRRLQEEQIGEQEEQGGAVQIYLGPPNRDRRNPIPRREDIGI